MFNFRRKAVITVTFDPYHNLPTLKAKNCTPDQIQDAATFMRAHVRLDLQKRSRRTTRRRKKEHRLHKFFRVLSEVVFNDGGRVEQPTAQRYYRRHTFDPIVEGTDNDYSEGIMFLQAKV